MTSVEKWLKRTIKKGPFFLLEKTPITYHAGFDENKKPIRKAGFRYRVSWKQPDGKVRLGVVQDGMPVRYGIGTLATLTGGSASGLWQINPGAVSEEELEQMIRVARGKCVLPTFDPSKLKGIVP